MVVWGIHQENRAKYGFSLAEVLLAFALLTIAILALLGLSISALKAGQKSTNIMDASQMSVRLLSDVAEKVKADPAFWASDHKAAPFETGAIRVGKTDYTYEIYSETLLDVNTGTPIGMRATNNRIKKLDVVVKWFGDGPKGGYGKRTMRESCLINEGS